ncbi:hypothetical protein [Luteimonas fraxinea]|uniref:hypothetical protein n=1 Tax=Luteimonas fraxinea TaxID=2901869 RepID=UPI001E634164|nr:hypothetical protein [Luteimonas fraxinea]MCD9125986.1 hypothetical protein [Luteimonas fraxinea]
MAENEVLDFGHATRWRVSRRALRDPLCSLGEFVNAASVDCAAAIRNLPRALRQGPALMTLLRALEGSVLGLQETVAAFTEKRLANVVIAAARCASNASPAVVAQEAASRMLESMSDQIISRAWREQRFASPSEQVELRAALGNEFGAYQQSLAQAIESSLGGTPVRSINLPKLPVRRNPAEVAVMSLVPAKRPEAPHARH